MAGMFIGKRFGMIEKAGINSVGAFAALLYVN